MTTLSVIVPMVVDLTVGTGQTLVIAKKFVLDVTIVAVLMTQKEVIVSLTIVNAISGRRVIDESIRLVYLY